MPESPIDLKSSQDRDSASHADQFQTDQVATIAGGHFVHDTFSGFFATILPLVQTNLNLSYSALGGLGFFLQIPSILTPFIGYLADRLSVRYFIIFAPAVTATIMSVLGLAPTYFVLILLLLACGVSIAAFHAPAPAMIAHVAGNNVGRGMSLFMASGELGRTFGPILVVAVINWFGFGGVWRIAIVGWLVSAILFWRLRDISARSEKRANFDFRTFLADAAPFYGLLTWIMVSRVLMLVAITTWLPTFMQDVKESSLGLAAFSLTILEAAGVVGALSTGTLSDYIGRRQMLIILSAISPFVLLLFLYAPAWAIIPLLILLGLTAITTTPVILAAVQDQFPNDRALANGLYMMINFLTRGLAAWVIGLLADRFGLANTFVYIAIFAFLALPAIWMLPQEKK